MGNNPEKFSKFYNEEKLGFDLKLVSKGHQFFKPFFKGSVALELGPATGYMTKLLKDDFEQLHIVEGSESLLKQIPDYANVVKTHSLFENYEPTIKFDTIILNHVLEHIEFPLDLLHKIGGWIKEEGVVIIGVPNAKSFHRLAAVKMGLLKTEYSLNSRDIELGHYQVFDSSLLRENVKKAGFKIIHEGGIFLKFLSNSQIETFLDESVINAYFDLSEKFKENCAEIFVVCTI